MRFQAVTPMGVLHSILTPSLFVRSRQTSRSFVMNKLVTAISISLLLSLACFGQATAGRGAISGTVLDASGSPVPDAKVVVSNPSLGLNRELTTTGAGIFS